jgi:protocatechuate 3,4-dioxygenase beta subunit
MSDTSLSRRMILRNWLAITAAGAAATMIGPRAGAQPIDLDPTPSCGRDEATTRPGSEGPYYSPQPPAKSNFRPEAPGGEPITLLGFVLTQQCRPIAGATEDLWHADHEGEYDNDGYRLRGYQLTDDQGRYAFETVVPAPYDWRTRHFHVKVQPPSGRLLTTQLYFPGEERNERDFLFHPRLLMDVQDAADGKVARFDFVLG